MRARKGNIQGLESRLGMARCLLTVNELSMVFVRRLSCTSAQEPPLDQEHPSQMKTRALKASSSAKKPLKLLPKGTVADPFQFARRIQRCHVVFASDFSFILHD
jgi:hypothetical protein